MKTGKKKYRENWENKKRREGALGSKTKKDPF